MHAWLCGDCEGSVGPSKAVWIRIEFVKFVFDKGRRDLGNCINGDKVGIDARIFKG